MLISTLECTLDRGLAEQVIEQSVKVITLDGVLFRQEEWGDSLHIVKSGEVTLTIEAEEREVHDL